MFKKIYYIGICIVVSQTLSCGVAQIQNVDKTLRSVNALELKTKKQDVISQVGPPAIRKVEMYKGGQLEVLYYKTWTQTAVIGIEYAASFTPLYFYNGILVMIGDQVSARYLDPVATMNAFSKAFPSRQQIDVFIYD